MIRINFTPEAAKELAKKESKKLITILVVIFSLGLLAMAILVTFTERSFKLDALNIFLLVLAFCVNLAIILAGAFVLYKYFIYVKTDFNSNVEIEIGEDYVIKHVNRNGLNVINQVGFWRNERRMIKEIFNKKISSDDLYQTKITKKGIKFYTSGPNGITVPAAIPNYHSVVDFVKNNGEKFKLVG